MLNRFQFLLLSVSLCAQPRDYPVKPVPFTSVHFKDQFWAPRIETNRTVTIPFAFQKDEETGRVDNFERAAAVLKGTPPANLKPPGYPFDDTDLYKVIEGAAYSLSVTPDAKLEAYCDRLIEKIAAAQERDGYIYTTRTIDPLHPHPWAGPERWKLESVDSHELYNLGHLYEAAVAYYQATGKRTMLDVSLRSAELLDKTFGPGKQSIWPGHQITEMGLAKLYRVTGEQRYLQLAKFLLDARGPQDGRQGGGRIYNQSHVRVVDQDEAVGHAVRATYMYSGMADVAALTADESYVQAIDRIWENVVAKKLYITGGIGATSSGEAFGKNYQLPNMTAYNETCAAIGNDYWNERLFLLHADAKYIDVMERTLYNGLISGVSLDGKTFFYPNPLESNGQHARSPWFGVACCPSNMTRFMASVPGYVYGERGDGVWVNLFVASTAEIQLDNGRKVKITQDTKYPWDGVVRMGVDTDAELALHVRIPGWARNEPVPSDLYRFKDKADSRVELLVNGARVPLKIDKGYVELRRKWKPSDVVELRLPMEVRRVVANDAVADDAGRVALQRGPIVYAAEWVDNPNGHVRNLVLPANQKLRAEFDPALLHGAEVLRGRAVAFETGKDGKVSKREQAFTAIPYYAWANRGSGQMMVWFPENEAGAKPAPYPGLAQKAAVTVSGRTGTGAKNPKAINDGEIPASSKEHGSYYDWWPKKGSPMEWVEYAFAAPAVVSESGVYWFDDTGEGEVRVPASWRILYSKDGAWVPVELTGGGGYGSAKDVFNKVTFRPVTTDRLRLELKMQDQWSAGIQEWTIR